MGILSHQPLSKRRSVLVRVVVLDVDGTLMDTNYLHVDAWARALEDVGRPAPMATIHKQIGKGSDQLIKEFVEDEETAEKVNELHGEYYSKLQERGRPLPGASELLSSLVGEGYECWLVTSAKPEELEHHMELLEASDKLAGVVSSDDVENTKPAPDIFELALERAGASPQETIAVGDSVWDIEAAKGAGVRTVAVLTGGAFSAGDLEEAGAVAVYEDCAKLTDLDFLARIG